MLFLINDMKIIKSEDTVFTELLTDMFLKE